MRFFGLLPLILAWWGLVFAADSPKIVYLTDVEGHWSRVEDFLRDNPAIESDGHGGWRVRNGYVFVYGGDAVDKGPNPRQFLHFMSDLKASSPDRMFEIAGNRDVIKVLVQSELSERLPKEPSERYKRWLAEKGLKDTRSERLRWMLAEMMGAPKLYENWRTELAQARGVERSAISDDEVTQDIYHDFGPNGAMGRYLASAELIHREGETLFVHGAVTDENLFLIPDDPSSATETARRAGNLDEWISESNAWYRGRIEAWKNGASSPDEEAGAAKSLARYSGRQPGTYANSQSLIYARFSDETGASTLSPDVERVLASAGIRRVVVGHTPSGHTPTILRGNKVEVIIADNSTEAHGVLLALEGNRAEVRSQVNLDSGPVPVKFSWKLDDPREPIGKTLFAASGEVLGLVTARTESGDYMIYRNLRDGDAWSFRSSYRQVPEAAVREGTLRAPYKAAAEDATSCAARIQAALQSLLSGPAPAPQ
ncbi:MAG: metallophosphoesterase [Oligoflexia bacterium]|nr:metallophosphoesterase [Oligoflexia bacterium]